MPKVNLRQAFVDSPPIPQDKPKIDYFDKQLTGFLLEVRSSGTCTYYLRYRVDILLSLKEEEDVNFLSHIQKAEKTPCPQRNWLSYVNL